MHELVLHPDCSRGPITRVTAEIEPTANGCRTRFRLEGDIGAIAVPARSEPARTDNLWKATCFEIFWQPDGGTYYREFNLSPSMRWAAYDFDAFRENARDAPVEAISANCDASESELVLEADIASDLPLPATVALNAIVEHADGTLQCWALAFPPGRPEFHSEACRKIALAR